MSWLPMGKTNCRTAARSMRRLRPQGQRARRMAMAPSNRPLDKTVHRPALARAAARSLLSRATLRESRNESIQAVHFAASRHHAFDGGHFAGGLRGLPAVAGFRAAPGRLPNHTGADVLSRRQSGSDGVVRHGAAGTAIWPAARPESDDFHEFLLVLHP